MEEEEEEEGHRNGLAVAVRAVLAGDSTGVHVPEKSGLLCATAMTTARIAGNRQALLNMFVPF